MRTNDERAAFLQLYINDPIFTKRPPTEDELEMMGNYLLWGKDPTTDKNAVQDKLVSIPTKHGTWDHNDGVESLDALMEQPTFNEAQVINNTAPPKRNYEKFSRKEALALSKDNPFIQQTFNNLFTKIDELDYQINFYELSHSKRNEIRQQLIAKISEGRQLQLQESTKQWTQYKYLKSRHYLVELRNEQFTLRDSIVSPILQHGTVMIPEETSKLTFGVDVKVFPLGVKEKSNQLLFKEFDDLNPQGYTEDELKVVSKKYWDAMKQARAGRFIDFTDEECVYQLFLMYWELIEDAEEDAIDENTKALMDTLNYYVRFANLSDLQMEILEQKKKFSKNSDIAFQINKKYGKNYTANYISTIFKQKIIPMITAAAKMHQEIVGNLFFEENFKPCTCCGRTYLISAEYFVRKSRSKDGFANKCKRCDKIERQEKKVINNG